MDVEKTIEFLLAHQAQVATESAARDQRIDKLSETVAKHDEQIQVIAGAVHALIRNSEEHRLANEELRQAIQIVSANTDHCTENINALIKVVDGLINRGSGHQGR